MMRVRSIAFTIACLAGACVIFAGVMLNDALLRSGDVLVDWTATRWSGGQIEAYMQYAGAISFVLIALSLILIFVSSIHAKKQ